MFYDEEKTFATRDGVMPMWQIFQRVGINTSENTQPHTENLQILLVPLESAKRQLEKKEKMEELPDAYDQRRKVCATCHRFGHNKARCTKHPRTDVS